MPIVATIDALADMPDRPHWDDKQPLLYGNDSYLSHQVRLVLLEKVIGFGQIFISDSQYGSYTSHDNDKNEQVDWQENWQEDLATLNPYNTLPIFVHRELILYQNTVIFEYLEERYPQYKLLPDSPIERANYRQLLWRISHDWVALADILLTHPDTLDPKKAMQARKSLTESLVTIAPLFAHKPFFLSDTLGLCDCVLATILWRLEIMQITLPAHLVRPLLHYMQRIFARENFKKSLQYRGNFYQN